jgi:hypothetical protein
LSKKEKHKGSDADTTRKGSKRKQHADDGHEETAKTKKQRKKGKK